MSQEVRVVVKQETQGNALSETQAKIQQLRTEAETLRKAADSYAKSGDGFDDPRAKSARAEAAAREREANRLERPQHAEEKAAQKAERDARAQELRAERAAAREAAEEKRKLAHEDKAADRQDAKDESVAQRRQIHSDELRAMELRAAGDHKGAEALERQNAIRNRALQLQRDLGYSHAESARFAEREAAALQRGGRGSLGTALSSVAGASGLPGGGLAGAGLPSFLAAVAGAIGGKTVMDEVAFGDTKAREAGAFERGANRRRQIKFGTFGDSAADTEATAYSDRRDNKQELDAALAARGTFKDQGLMDKILGFSNRWLGTQFETSGQRGERENEERIARLKKEKPQLEAQAMKEFQSGQGARELELGRRTAAGDRVGARAIEHEMLWWDEYNRLKNKLGEKGEEIAQESANNKVAIAQRNANMRFAGMLSARSGAGDIARVGALIDGGIHSYQGGGVKEAIGQLTETVKGQHSDIKTNMPAPGKPRPDLRGNPL